MHDCSVANLVVFGVDGKMNVVANMRVSGGIPLRLFERLAIVTPRQALIL
ncbi:MAG: hypothetical protein AAGF56_07050 [Pseudomonadota bacterium]